MESLLRRDLIKIIERYQYSIQHVNPPERDPQKILHYIRKLSKLPIKLEELEKTGIGKTINALRKCQGSVGDEAGLLVGKWKAIAKRQVQEEEEDEWCKQNTHSDYEFPADVYNYNVSKSNATIELDFKKIQPLNPIQEIKVESFKEKVSPSQDPINDRKRNYSFPKSTFEIKEKCVKRNSGSDFEDENCSDERDMRKGIAHKTLNFEDELRNYDGKKKKDTSANKMLKKGREKKHYKSNKLKDDRNYRRHDSGRNSHLEKKCDLETYRDRRDKRKDLLNEAHHNERYGFTNTKENIKSSSKYLSNGSGASPINDYCSDSNDYYDDDSPENSTDEDFVSKYTSNIPSSPGTNFSRNSGNDFDALSNSIKMEPSNETDIENTSKSRLKEIEEQALNSMTTTKNQRTKVFSGCKSRVMFKCPTLYDLCGRILEDHFDCLEYTGGVPYDVLRPVLEKVTVEQLYTFENYNPYLIGETNELWEYHVARHFRQAKRREYETWRDVYLRCVEERDEKLQTLTENISQSIANSTPVRQVKLAYSDAYVKPPRNVARNQAKHGTAHITVKRSTKGPQPSPAAVQSVKERLAQANLATPQAVNVASRNPLSTIKKKKAPLMLKSLQLLRGLKR